MEISFPAVHTRRLCLSSSSVCLDYPNHASNLSPHHARYGSTIHGLYVTRRGKGRGKRNRCRNREEEGFCWNFSGSSLLAKRRSCQCVGKGRAFREESGCVEVIGIGSRVESVLDFCLRSPSASSTSSPLSCLRFWNFVMKDSQQRVLQQRLLETDQNRSVMEAMDPQSSAEAVLLVASAGYGDDLTIVLDILRAVKSNGGLVVAVILKPFDFEGRRRQEEVRALLHKLQECANFCIEIDINALLKMDLVTLDEALKTTNQAVFLAIRAVSVFISGTPTKHIVSRIDELKELKAKEIMEVLECYKQGNIGFGVGRDVETSILQAVHHCPFLCRPLKDLNGLVICILNSANTDQCDDVPGILHAFRQMTECKQDMIISVVYDPSLQPNVIAATVIIMSANEQRPTKKTSILSKLAKRMPFVFDFLRNQEMDPDNSKFRDPSGVFSLPTAASHLNNTEILDAKPEVEDFEMHDEKTIIAREQNSEDELIDSDAGSSKYYQHNSNAYQRELLLSWDKVVENNTFEELSDEVAMTMGATSQLNDKPSVFPLPVGVRDSVDTDYLNTSGSRMDARPKTKDDTVGDTLAAATDSSWNAVADAGVEAVTGFYQNATALLKGKSNGTYKKQGVLSSRAASMLDAERGSQIKWRHTTQISYRGGVYKGHCQGGLPEGRGRLQYPDGSAYDGMWHYGKRSGLGSFYYSNGDVFQGTWRDDLMHGKGWFYFQNGDRWFANFWKGRANGEGRFYSKSGEVFFGRFQDGYRHGEFQCVKVDGSRFVEAWTEGVLISSEAVDYNTNSAL